MRKMVFAFLTSLVLVTNAYAAKSPSLDVRDAIAEFFPLNSIEGLWEFKSMDGKCRLRVEHWLETGVIKLELVQGSDALGTSYSTVIRREQTEALYNDHFLSYMSFFSDFGLTKDYMFVVDGVYRYSGVPGDPNSNKKVHLSRSFGIEVKMGRRHVNYVATENDLTITTACTF